MCQDCPLWAVLACGAFNTDVDLLFLTAAGMRGGGGRRDRKSRCEDVKCKGRSSSAPSRLDGFKKQNNLTHEHAWFRMKAKG